MTGVDPSFPESPSVQTTHCMPTVSAKLFQQQPSPEKFYETQNLVRVASPTKSEGKNLKQKNLAIASTADQAALEQLSVEQLAVEFFRSAMGDSTCEELEKVQLQ